MNAAHLSPATPSFAINRYVYAPMTLQAILSLSITSDQYEEDAQDYLDDHSIPYSTHNRQALITLAYRNGWRPEQ